jgi:hypothetical protein
MALAPKSEFEGEISPLRRLILYKWPKMRVILYNSF